MEPDFWLQRWQHQEIGFHLDYEHPLLKRYGSSFFRPAPVFVPLCGKSLDLLYLKRLGCAVTGVELSEQAIQQFQKDNHLKLNPTEINQLTCFQQQDIAIYQADVFQLTSRHLHDIHQVYDRAALIALPAESREQYVEHLLKILPRPLSYMLITLEYPQHEMQGPPFSVSQQEVEQLFETATSIEQIHYNSIIDKEPIFKSKGVSKLHECVYKIIVE